MNNKTLLLPFASLIEILGVLTLLTNESVIGPIDLGITIPYVVSADIQGVGLFIIGSLIAGYAITQIQ
jgi:hypothetical protein